MNMIPFLLMNVIITGNKILDSIFGQGLQNLFNDGIGAAQLIGGLVVVIVFIIVSMKKSNEEEQERKRYTKWQLELLALGVMILLAPDLFDLIQSFFIKG